MRSTVARIGGNLSMNSLRHKCQIIRDLSTSKSLNDVGKSLRYKEYGEPTEVLQLTDHKAKKPEANEVKWLLAPVNPADINTIQGKYPSKPPLPAIAGNEGIGEVACIGSDVKGLAIGDRVVPDGINLGTWTTYATYPSDQLLKVPKELGKIEASMLNVNPCTAYRMLKDFVVLKPGDSVIQNGGNSAVGQFVIQLCRIWDLKSVSVVRDRPNFDEVKSELCRLGANKVLTEQEIRKTEIFKKKEFPKPVLALNCIGGQNAVDVLRHVANEGTMVTYGGMSREPVTIPTSALIFKDISLKGFWMTAWVNKNAKSEERWNMLESLGKMFQAKELEVPKHKIIPICNYHEAIEKTLQLDGKAGTKYILDVST